jgi:uncharacterized damage-inducible protein DinB
MTREEVRTLYRYNAWANGRLLDSCGLLTPEEFTRDLGSSFRSVRDTLAHIMGAEWIWLERWRGRSPSRLPEGWGLFGLPGLRRQWSEVERDLLAFVDHLSPEDLGKTVEYRNVRGNRFAYPLEQMLAHVVNHGTYHRGQVASVLRRLGAQPRATDYLRYFDSLAGGPEK